MPATPRHPPRALGGLATPTGVPAGRGPTPLPHCESRPLALALSLRCSHPPRRPAGRSRPIGRTSETETVIRSRHGTIVWLFACGCGHRIVTERGGGRGTGRGAGPSEIFPEEMHRRPGPAPGQGRATRGSIALGPRTAPRFPGRRPEPDRPRGGGRRRRRPGPERSFPAGPMSGTRSRGSGPWVARAGRGRSDGDRSIP